jgi:PiT family inorganic phosphate transporter
MDANALGLPVLVALIAVALLFDLLNGFHDAANSIATVVATRVLRPQTAVIWAAFFNFVAFAVFGLHVARTVGTGIVSAGVVDGSVIFGALSGAIVWNIVTWRVGIPSSSSHALIGGLTGAAIAKAGLAAVVYGGLGITALGIVLSPLLGFTLAQLLVVIVHWASRNSAPFAVDRHSACCNSFLRRCTRSVMAATMRRRRWASLRCCSFRKASSGTNFTFLSGW